MSDGWNNNGFDDYNWGIDLSHELTNCTLWNDEGTESVTIITSTQQPIHASQQPIVTPQQSVQEYQAPPPPQVIGSLQDQVEPTGSQNPDCTFQAKFSAVGPDQVLGKTGALGIIPPNDSLAINPKAFGLPYDTKAERAATQQDIRDNIANIRISAPGLSDYLTGETTFTIGDVGDRNIRNSPTTRFDIYRFQTQKDAIDFGTRTVPATITGLPKNWSCPK